MSERRVLYVQYTNPAAYPPLEHSSQLFANAGWAVLFLGTGAFGAHRLEFPARDRIVVRRLPFQSAGVRQKLHYLRFCAWVLRVVLRWRPHVLYASDLLSCPPAWAASLMPGLTIVYHEHDDPNATDDGMRSAFMSLALRSRRLLARRADLCVIPQRERAARFVAETRPAAPVFCVWNCPSSGEVLSDRRRDFGKGAFRLLYHGTIVPSRLPLTIVDALAALPEQVTLRVVGYAPVGHAGYPDELRDRARARGVGHRLELRGAIPERAEMLRQASECHLGLAFMPRVSEDINERCMVGASNKPFDYLACGLALLVGDLPDWRATYVESGYGLACDPDDPASIAAAVQRLADEPTLARSMGEAGRWRVIEEWNYERQFAPVLGALDDLA